MKINKKRYYRISFVLESPLMLGSGINVETDQDILCDKLGLPYIPASAIAGVSRDLLKTESDSVIEKYFGTIRQNGDNDTSKILFYDAQIIPEDVNSALISLRDSVALDEYKTAITGAKFDAEVLETGIRFTTYMEQNMVESDTAFADKICSLWLSGMMFFGAKTMRGYGQTKATEVLVREINLSMPKEVMDWVKYSMFQPEFWERADAVKVEIIPQNSLCLKLQQKGGISIRKYTTDIVKADKDAEVMSPDSTQLSLGNKTPVIPGTSWAGAFRHRMYELLPVLKTEKLFGDIEGGAVRSKIRFNETMIRNTVRKKMSHNAINRFSGAVEDTALFTEETCYGGTTELVISWSGEISTLAKTGLAAVVADLHYGLLSVGGLSSIGRGCFTVAEINGKKADSENIYQQLLTELSSEESFSEKEE